MKEIASFCLKSGVQIDTAALAFKRAEARCRHMPLYVQTHAVARQQPTWNAVANLDVVANVYHSLSAIPFLSEKWCDKEWLLYAWYFWFIMCNGKSSYSAGAAGGCTHYGKGIL